MFAPHRPSRRTSDPDRRNGAFGVAVQDGAEGNAVASNVIGFHPQGGVVLDNTAGNNLLSNQVRDPGATGNLVRGNRIGVGADGAALPNTVGIDIERGASNNRVGGTAPGAGNVIADNTNQGVVVGLAATATDTVGDAVLGNSIFGNGGSGIDVVASERYADGRVTAPDLAAARVRWPWGYGLKSAFRRLPDDLTWLTPDRAAEAAAQAALLRDIFGNPFRTVTLDPSWLTSTVVALAAGIDAESAFDRLPILAVALQDAGCDSAEVLDHCRDEGPHVRGCWVVALVLGKG
jgi:hypothetical protein